MTDPIENFTARSSGISSIASPHDAPSKKLKRPTSISLKSKNRLKDIDSGVADANNNLLAPRTSSRCPELNLLTAGNFLGQSPIIGLGSEFMDYYFRYCKYGNYLFGIKTFKNGVVV